MIFNKNQVQEYSSVYDAGDEKTVFQLGMIDHVLLARIIDSNLEVKQDENDDTNRKTVFRTEERNILFALCGLKGWSKFVDENGVEIPCEFEGGVILGIKTQIVKKSCLTKLLYSVVQELGAAIGKLNRVGEIERKNS